MIAIVRNNRTIVLANNQFRFDFFLLLKGIRPSVWETPEIAIGGKNPTDVNLCYY